MLNPDTFIHIRQTRLRAFARVMTALTLNCPAPAKKREKWLLLPIFRTSIAHFRVFPATTNQHNNSQQPPRNETTTKKQCPQCLARVHFMRAFAISPQLNKFPSNSRAVVTEFTPLPTPNPLLGPEVRMVPLAVARLSATTRTMYDVRTELSGGPNLRPLRRLVIQLANLGPRSRSRVLQ